MFLGRSFPSAAAFSMSHIFAGSFSSITSDQCYLSSLHNPFMSCIQPVCHLCFTINWSTPACSQLPTPTFSTHFLNFQTNTSLFLPCYSSSLGGARCKHFQSYFITSNLSLWCQQESSQWLDSWGTATIACHDSQACFPTSFSQRCHLKKTVCIGFISLRLFVSCVYYYYVNYYGKGCSPPRPGHATVIQINNFVVLSGGSVSIARSATPNTPTSQVLYW